MKTNKNETGKSEKYYNETDLCIRNRNNKAVTCNL